MRTSNILNNFLNILFLFRDCLWSNFNKYGGVWAQTHPNPQTPQKKGGPFVDSEVIQKTLENFNFATTTAILTKLPQTCILIRSLSKYWDVTHRVYEGVNKKPLKIFFRPISIISNTSVKTIAYLMHNLLACHHCSKFQTKLTTFWQVLAKKPHHRSLKSLFLLVQRHLKI